MNRFIDPNVEAVVRGELNPEMLRELVETFQRAHDLKVDGLAGPRTRGALTLVLMAKSHARPRVQQVLPLPLRALAVAVQEIGRGEDPARGDNQGADIERYKLATGLGVTSSDAWCAIFISYCFRQGAGQGSLPFLLSSGAKRLVKNIGDEGRYLEAPEPGAVISWHRSVMPWAGHVGIVESHDPDLDELVTIEGNKRTAGRKHALVDRFTYRRGEWRQKLHRIASI